MFCFLKFRRSDLTKGEGVRMNQMESQRVKERIESYRNDLVSFLSEFIRIQSLDGQEGEAAQRLLEEMEKVGFDEVKIDPMGNVIGRIGSGNTVIAMDGHIDVVDVGDESQWNVDPFSGFVKDDRIWGRGTADQKGGVAAMVYAAKAMKELDLLDGLTIYITGSVNEEDCDGLCWQYIIREDGLRPEFVVLTEPTDGRICRGQKGRMAIKITTKGISAHGSVPEQGENAIYKMAPIIQEIEALNGKLPTHPELGKGTITISQVFFSSASSCAVADGCTIILDRRLTFGETRDKVLVELQELESVHKAEARVEIIMYDVPTYTGLVYPSESYFPSWITPVEHPCIQAAISSFKALFQQDPVVDKWVFSTNGVAVSGLHGIPCVGYGPGDAGEAHKANESVRIEDLTRSAMMYVMIPQSYLDIKKQ
jgi:putative selenium metabolism hydrolase